MGFNTSSIWIKVAVICLLLGAILFVIGFATTSWMTHDYHGRYNSDSYGLWKRHNCAQRACGSHKITSRFLELANWEGWFRATQAFECLGLICVMLALLICILFVFVDSMRKRSPLIAIIVFCFVGSVCMAIGFAIFATKFSDAYSVGWSMGLAIAGCILTFVAGVMSLLDLKK